MRANFHITDSPTDYAPTDRLNQLLLKALDAGYSQERNGNSIVPTLIIETAGKYDLFAFSDFDFAVVRQMAGRKLAINSICDAYVLFAAAMLTGEMFQGNIKAIVAEGADRNMEYGYRLFGIPDDGRVVPIYDGHCDQLFGSGSV